MDLDIGSIIVRRRKELKLRQSRFAELMTDAGFPVTNQAISKWETGQTCPSASQLIAICDILGIEDIVSEVSEGRRGVLAGLNNQGRQKAMEYISLLKSSDQYAIPEYEDNIRELPLYNIAVSAGTGQFLDSDDYDMVQVGSEVPDGANFGVRVAGNSMEPRYHDGQKVWVHQQRSLMIGEIGIFVYDGNAYLKQLVAKENCMALHSLNPQYLDIPISADLPLRVLGKVL